MAYPPSVKFCFCRGRVIVSWPQAYFRETVVSADCVLTRDQAEQLMRDLAAALDADPEPDGEGRVRPALTRHLPAAGWVAEPQWGVDGDEVYEVVVVEAA